MKELPCIKQYVLEKRLKTITMTNNLAGMIFADNSILTPGLARRLLNY